MYYKPIPLFSSKFCIGIGHLYMVICIISPWCIISPRRPPVQSWCKEDHPWAYNTYYRYVYFYIHNIMWIFWDGNICMIEMSLVLVRGFDCNHNLMNWRSAKLFRYCQCPRSIPIATDCNNSWHACDCLVHKNHDTITIPFLFVRRTMVYVSAAPWVTTTILSSRTMMIRNTIHPTTACGIVHAKERIGRHSPRTKGYILDTAPTNQPWTLYHITFALQLCWTLIVGCSYIETHSYILFRLCILCQHTHWWGLMQ